MKEIHWLPWGKEAFDKAKKENKPILMDIFGVWCHWCHVMDKDTYEHSDVIEKIDRDFVPIRVDTDKRPDINERYNQGGWPTTVFLDHSGQIITGVTYVPPDQLLMILEQVSASYGKKPVKVPKEPLLRKKGVITEEILLHMDDLIQGYFDPHDGGFGEPKFPMPEVLEYCLQRYETTKNKGFLIIVEKTIQGILSGLYDKEAGGFFRYSVTPDWKLPHYEKMLDTNSGIIKVLSIACKIAGKGEYRDPLKKSVSYLLSVLADPTGGFYASQDADGEESYYGKSLEQRKNMPTPFIDKTVFADLNGLAIQALISYISTEKDRQAEEYLRKAVDGMVRNLCQKGKVAHYNEKEPIFLGLLRDHVNMGLALVQAYCQFKREEYLAAAAKIAQVMLSDFRDPEGGFFDKLQGGEGRLSIQQKHIGENTKAALFFLELGKILKEKSFQEETEKALEVFAIDCKAYGIMAAEYARVVEQFLREKDVNESSE